MADKKKRGEAGKSNAKSIPFRYGGSPCNYDTRIGSSDHPCGAGSLLVNAMRLGSILPGFNPSDRLIQRTDNAMERCTSPYLV